MTGSNNCWALDARTGRPFWSYRRELPTDLTYGSQAPVNRGFGILDNRLFMTTLDAHLLAFDRATGKILWDIVLADYKIGYSSTMAPLVIDGKVIVGISGGEYQTRDSSTPRSGRRETDLAFPHHSRPEWFGGTTWMKAHHGRAQSSVLGHGQSQPDYYGDDRKGDNPTNS